MTSSATSTSYVLSWSAASRCTAGALLLVRLAAAAGDLAAGLRLVRTLAGRRELRDHDLVHQRDVGLCVEDRVRQFDRTGRAAVDPDHVHSAHFAAPPVNAFA